VHFTGIRQRWPPVVGNGLHFAQENAYLRPMANEPESLLLVYLRRIDEKVDRLRDDVRELKNGLNGVRRDLIALAESDARLELIVDRQGERLDKIERRLDLRDS